MVTDVPTVPDVGLRLVILGAATSVKLMPLLAMPDTVTTTVPVVAPLGTVAVILPLPHAVMTVAVMPLNFTVLVPWVDPKFEPEIVTEAPTAPEVGDNPLIFGVARTVKVCPLLSTPLA